MTIRDSWLGEREVMPGVGMIVDQLQLLRVFRDDGREPSQKLLDDIKVYEFILNSAAPEAMAEAYFTESMRLSDERKTFAIDKMEVARNLGWVIQ